MMKETKEKKKKGAELTFILPTFLAQLPITIYCCLRVTHFLSENKGLGHKVEKLACMHMKPRFFLETTTGS